MAVCHKHVMYLSEENNTSNIGFKMEHFLTDNMHESQYNLRLYFKLVQLTAIASYVTT